MYACLLVWSPMLRCGGVGRWSPVGDVIARLGGGALGRPWRRTIAAGTALRVGPGSWRLSAVEAYDESYIPESRVRLMVSRPTT